MPPPRKVPGRSKRFHDIAYYRGDKQDNHYIHMKCQVAVPRLIASGYGVVARRVSGLRQFLLDAPKRVGRSCQAQAPTPRQDLLACGRRRSFWGGLLKSKKKQTALTSLPAYPAYVDSRYRRHVVERLPYHGCRGIRDMGVS